MWTAFGIRCSPLWNYGELFWNFTGFPWKYLELLGNIWNCLEIFGITWKFSELLGNIWNYIVPFLFFFLFIGIEKKTHFTKFYYFYLLIRNYLILSSILSRGFDTKSFHCEFSCVFNLNFLVFDHGKIAEFPIRKLQKSQKSENVLGAGNFVCFWNNLHLFPFLRSSQLDPFFFLTVYVWVFDTRVSHQAVLKMALFRA